MKEYARMKRTPIIAAALAGLVVLGIGAYLLRPSEQASAPIQSTPISVQPELSASPTAAAATQAEIVQPEASPTPEASAGQPADPDALTGTVIYQIAQEQSSVSFSIDEVLRGSPFTAVGTTDQVAGEIAIDFDNAAAQLGTIQVNARTLKTDNSMRDRMIYNEILDTAQYEFITFVPTTITGLPGSIAIGDTVTFQITGDLTIRNVTKPVTFEVTVNLAAKDHLEGVATATVLRSDFQITIPSVPQVASVSEEVKLAITFTASAK